MLSPVVSIAGMFGPVLRVILLPVPWQGGATPGEHPLKLYRCRYILGSQIFWQMSSQSLAKKKVKGLFHQL